MDAGAGGKRGLDGGLFVLALATGVAGVVIMVACAALARRVSRLRAAATSSAAHELQSAQVIRPEADKASKAKAAAVAKRHATAAAQEKRHEDELNVIKGHAADITAIAVSSDGSAIASACVDHSLRIFRLDDIHAKTFRFQRINMDRNYGVGLAFGDGTKQLIVATETPMGSELLMYSLEDKPTADNKSKAHTPSWHVHECHKSQGVLTLAAGGDHTVLGSVVASCSEGTMIRLWSATTGKLLAEVDTSQLKNHMAAVSPDGRFLAAAAFTADAKLWEIAASKEGAFKQLNKVMQLKGHTRAVTWLDFGMDSKTMATASKDGTWKLWNIDVRYHMDEDPKCLLTVRCALEDAAHYDFITLAPGGGMVAAAVKKTVHFFDCKSGKLLHAINSPHEGDVTSLQFLPQHLKSEHGPMLVLVTAGTDRKIRLWRAPDADAS